MNVKKNDKASALPTTTKREQSGSKVLDAEQYLFFRPQVAPCAPVIDADAQQAEAQEIKPRPQSEVIVA